MKRNNMDFSPIQETIVKNSLIINLDEEIAVNAGKLHGHVRSKNKRISLADCIIAESARKYGAIVLTTDHHFKILGNAIILEK